jgi:hypothetical protein
LSSFLGEVKNVADLRDWSRTLGHVCPPLAGGEEKSWSGIQKKPGPLDLVKVSFETSFNLKQPKLESKRLFLLFRFYTETECFGVSIEPKQTEEQPKQCDREHILVFFRKLRVVQVYFGSF